MGSLRCECLFFFKLCFNMTLGLTMCCFFLLRYLFLFFFWGMGGGVSKVILQVGGVFKGGAGAFLKTLT